MHTLELTFPTAIRRLVCEEYVDQRLRIVRHCLAMRSANVYRHLRGVVVNLQAERCNLECSFDDHSFSATHLNLAILGERRTLEVETTTQLVVHQIAGVRTEGALVRRTEDIGLPLEPIGTVLNRT